MPKIFTLFHPDGSAVHDYEKIIRNLNPGDEVLFSDGTKFTIKNFFKKANTVMMYETLEGKILRLPSERVNCNDVGRFNEGYRTLNAENVPTAQVTFSKEFPNEYSLVEKIEVKRLLGERGKSANWDGFTPEMTESFGEFTKKTSMFKQIGDFKPDQLAWDGKRWVLLDWSDDHLYTAFNPSSRGGSIRKIMRNSSPPQAIIDVVENALKRKSFFKSCLFNFILR